MQTANDIRAAFLDYFARQRPRDRAVEPARAAQRPDPAVHQCRDGAVQERLHRRSRSAPYSRAATSQKCVRAGGKHNDLENVGYTARHHTFFEMLGNFSFGDYFKERAIELAWNLITKEFGLPQGPAAGHGLCRGRRGGARCGRRSPGCRSAASSASPTSDNFWAMGDTGPCGPCSEIFYDHGDAIPGGPPGSADAGRRPLHRDLEPRLHAVRAGRAGRAHRAAAPVDRYRHGARAHRRGAAGQARQLRHRSVPRPDRGLGRGLAASRPTGRMRSRHRVIADHLRASSFLIADGVLPSKEGRGYVLRRIMRRAMRHAHMHRLQGAADVASGAGAGAPDGRAPFPSWSAPQALITETLKLEETGFKQTLERGLRLLDEEDGASCAPAQALPGEVAFKLYDTYGFPLDLTQDVLRARSRKVAVDGFDAAMERQRADARQSWVGSGEAATEPLWFALREQARARPSSSATTPRTPKARSWRSSSTASRVDGGRGRRRGRRSSSTRRRSTASPAARWAIPGSMFAARRRRVRGARYHEESRRALRPSRHGDARRLERRRRGRAARRRDAAPALRANHSVTHLLHQALRRRARRACDAEGLARGARPHALRFQPSASR